MKSHKPNPRLLLVSLALLALPFTAQAKRVQVDFGPESFPSSGAGWPGFDGASFDDQVDVASGPHSGSMLFATQYEDSGSILGTYTSSPLLVNGSVYDSIRIYEDGGFSFFDSALGPQSVDPFFSVYGADLVSDPTAFATSPGSVSYTIGFSMGLAGGTPDASAALPGIRLYWNNLPLATDGNQTQDFQAYIYFLGGGDFDLDFRYGAGDWSASAGTQSINVAGSQIYSNASAIVEEADYFFSFRNGVLQGGGTDPDPPVGVPEPGTGALLIAGLGILLASMRRRRASR